MPISDLTGYTWVGNSNITTAPSGWDFATDDGNTESFDINFSFEYDSLIISAERIYFNDIDVSSYVIRYYVNSTPWEVYLNDSGWKNNAYKTIQITGGTDATNATLIAWLEANGTLTAPAPSISDLTGTKWLINDNLTVPASNYVLQINNLLFASNSVSFEGLLISRRVSNPDIFVISYGADTIVYDYNNYTGQGTGWTSQAYRTIEITGGRDVTNTSLIAWLEANATQVVPATPSLNFGGSDVSLFLGSTYVSKVYLGSTLLYEGEAPTPNNAILTADNTYLVDSTGGYLLTTEI